MCSFLYPAKYEISFQWIGTFFIVVWILAQSRNWSNVDKKGVSCLSAYSTQNVHSRLVRTTCWSAHRIVLVHRCLVVSAGRSLRCFSPPPFTDHFDPDGRAHSFDVWSQVLIFSFSCIDASTPHLIFTSSAPWLQFLVSFLFASDLKSIFSWLISHQAPPSHPALFSLHLF